LSLWSFLLSIWTRLSESILPVEQLEKPTVVGYTQEDMQVWNEVMMRVYAMAETNSKDIIHNAYGYGLFTGGLGFHSAAKKLGAAIVPSSGGFTSRQIMLMRDFGATVLASTPTFALHLAEVAQKEGYDLNKDFYSGLVFLALNLSVLV